MGSFPCGEEQDDDSMSGPAQAGQQAGGSKGLIVRMCGKDDERGPGRHGLDPERGKILHTGFRCSDQQPCGPLKLIGEHQHIQRETSPHLSLVQPVHHRREIVVAEILSPLSGVEGIHTEIDRIGP